MTQTYIDVKDESHLNALKRNPGARSSRQVKELEEEEKYPLGNQKEMAAPMKMVPQKRSKCDTRSKDVQELIQYTT